MLVLIRERAFLFPILLLPVLISCGAPTIDGSSDEAFTASIREVSGSLSEEKRQEFQAAVAMVMMSNVDIGAMFSGEDDGTRSNVTTRQALDGKTAAEVIAMAAEIEADIERERLAEEARSREAARTQALEEIEELRQKQREDREARQKLSSFEVTRSRFYTRKERYSVRPQPILELTVRNLTGTPVSRAYFRGTIQSPGRSTPWLSDTFNYEIPGGIEPGETASWELGPNPYSAWGRVEAPSDAVFTVEVLGLETPNGSIERSFDEDDEERLSKLVAEYGKQDA